MIDHAPTALTSRLCPPTARDHHIVAAGSLLGLALHENGSFPVGKVDSLTLSPMSFIEYLRAIGRQALAQSVARADFGQLEPVFADELMGHLKEYLFIGGMPEVVADFVQHRDYAEARRLQRNILTDYDRDFSKHVPARTLEKVRLVWGSVPAQLAKQNRKFIYSAVRSGARAKDLEEAIHWLADYGVVHKVPLVSAIRTPLKSYASFTEFKLFTLDVGLLGAMSGLEARSVLEGSALFTEFKGALAEQYVEQQLRAADTTTYYWSSPNSSNEIDFVIECAGQTLPVEVKAGENLRSKSLQAVRDKYGLPLSIRTSASGFRDDGWLVNLPLWSIGSLRQALETLAARPSAPGIR